MVSDDDVTVDSRPWASFVGSLPEASWCGVARVTFETDCLCVTCGDRSGFAVSFSLWKQECGRPSECVVTRRSGIRMNMKYCHCFPRRRQLAVREIFTKRKGAI